MLPTAVVFITANLHRSMTVCPDFAAWLKKWSACHRDQSIWTDLATKFDRHFSHVVGRARQVVETAKRAGRIWGQSLNSD